MATRISVDPEVAGRSIAFWTMSTLSLERRRDVHRRVGDDQRVRMARHVHHEAVADAARGPEPGLSLHHRGHQLVGVEATLHQGLRLGVADELHRPGRRLLAVPGLHDAEPGDVEARFLRDLSNAGGWSDEDRRGISPTREGRLDCAAERGLVARMSDRGGRGGYVLAAGDQPVVLLVRRFHEPRSLARGPGARGRRRAP